MAIFFTMLLTFLSNQLPQQIAAMLSSYGFPRQIVSFLSSIPVSGLLFGAFLGVAPTSAIPSSLLSLLPSKALQLLNSRTFLPELLEPSFMSALRMALYISSTLVLTGAIFSFMRGADFFPELKDESSPQRGS
jgi:hypothetical protein